MGKTCVSAKLDFDFHYAAKVNVPIGEFKRCDGGNIEQRDKADKMKAKPETKTEEETRKKN